MILLKTFLFHLLKLILTPYEMSYENIFGTSEKKNFHKIFNLKP